MRGDLAAGDKSKGGVSLYGGSMDGGSETGETEHRTGEGDDAGENGVEHGADEECNAGDRRADCRRSGLGDMSNKGKDGSTALRLESKGNQLLAKAETAGTAAHNN